MAEALDVAIAGQHLRLLADRALFWPARQRLLIADLHLGKGGIFRRAGIAVPGGGTQHDLIRLEVLLRATQARELWILGDFLHGRADAVRDTQWREFAQRNAHCAITVIAGNHDRALQGSPLHVRLHADALRDGPFVFRHEPVAADAAHVICGHVHPVLRLPGLSGRYAAFVLQRSMTVLPAFSAFTGGMLVDPSQADGLVISDGQQLQPIGLFQALP